MCETPERGTREGLDGPCRGGSGRAPAGEGFWAAPGVEGPETFEGAGSPDGPDGAAPAGGTSNSDGAGGAAGPDGASSMESPAEPAGAGGAGGAAIPAIPAIPASPGGLAGGGFWAVPGVDRPGAPGAPEPGVAPVGSYQPEADPQVSEVIAMVRKLGGVGQLVAVAHATALELGSRVGPGAPDAAGAGAGAKTLDHITGLMEAGNALGAVTSELVGAADREGLANRATATGEVTWLMLKANLTRSQASRLVVGARKAARFGLARRAALAGGVN
ncbi:MAG: hypothetical protein LBG60_00860, partial [Bifidobacteriaceae bacterium]|nr:hypothetical protein [Bifidobacteriaceae bacterium]